MIPQMLSLQLTHYMAHDALASNKLLVQCTNTTAFRTVVSAVCRKKNIYITSQQKYTITSSVLQCTDSTLFSDGEQKCFSQVGSVCAYVCKLH
jgi:hypothetical protein